MVLIVGLGFAISACDNAPAGFSSAPDVPVHAPVKFGFNTDSFEIDEFTLAPNAFLGDLLSAQGVPYLVIDELARKAKGVFDVRSLRAGKTCAYVRKVGTGGIDCFVYEPSPYRFVRYHVHDTVRAELVERDVEVCVETSGGAIESSLWLAMEGIGHKQDLIARMEDALAWEVSFQHVQPGDQFKLIYEQKYIDNEAVGIGQLIGAYFETSGKAHYAIYFESDNYDGFLDLEGRPMKRAFLRSPVKFSRISSRFSTRRFHPILKRYKGHFGTDYAAAYGTPIVAVAAGVVTKASYTKGNGNYVKIKHDGTYETQYLHMSKFAKGIKPGTHVKQNDVIGYVGATGLATGPHVCFRFWKNGRQVDHLRENLPPPEPMPDADMPRFMEVRDLIMPQIDMIDIQAFQVAQTETNRSLMDDISGE